MTETENTRPAEATQNRLPPETPRPAEQRPHEAQDAAERHPLKLMPERLPTGDDDAARAIALRNLLVWNNAHQAAAPERPRELGVASARLVPPPVRTRRQRPDL